jgi:hypothetical protein
MPVKTLASILLCSAAFHASATLLPRDIDGDGRVDAYYQPSQNVTWVAGTVGGGNFYDQWAVLSTLYPQASLTWRLPRLLTMDFSEATALAIEGVPALMYESLSGGQPIWLDGNICIDGVALTPIEAFGSQISYVADPYGNKAAFLVLTDGDPCSLIPEPGTYALSLLGLGVIGLARGYKSYGRPYANPV